MENEERKESTSHFDVIGEIIFLTAAGIALYFIGIKWVLGREWDYPWRIIPISLSALIVLVVDVVWIVALKKWMRLKNVRIKIMLKILTMFVFTLSAMIFTDIFVIHLFRNMW